MIDVDINEIYKFNSLLEPDTDANVGLQCITVTVNVKQVTVSRHKDIFKKPNLPLPEDKKKKSLLRHFEILTRLSS